MLGQEADISLILHKGLPAEVWDATPLDRKFIYILSDMGTDISDFSRGISLPEAVAIKLQTNLNVFATLLKYSINIDQEAISFGNNSMPGRVEITLQGLARFHGKFGGVDYFNSYLYPGMVPCLIRNIQYSHDMVGGE